MWTFDINFENVDGGTIDLAPVSQYIPTFMDALYNPDTLRMLSKEELRDMFHTNQMASKAWLLEKFSGLTIDRQAHILIVGSWCGFLTLCLQKMGYMSLTEVELDSKCLAISQNVVDTGIVRYHTDINSFSTINNYDVIINLACEHIVNDNWFKRIDADKILILQSNNLVHPQHTNICTNITDMVQKYPMTTMFYGTLILNTYNRFMMIGRK